MLDQNSPVMQFALSSIKINAEIIVMTVPQIGFTCLHVPSRLVVPYVASLKHDLAAVLSVCS